MQGIVPDPPAMGFLLADAAYRDGERWRMELLDYLKGNRDYAMRQLVEIEGLVPYSPEATYLMWIDALGIYQYQTLTSFLRKMEWVYPMAEILMLQGFYA